MHKIQVYRDKKGLGHFGVARLLKRAAAAAIKKNNSKVWVNTLWPVLCGGQDDDLAVQSPEKAEQVYGYMIKHGATLIQTDRIDLLINYLRSKGLHD